MFEEKSGKHIWYISVSLSRCENEYVPSFLFFEWEKKSQKCRTRAKVTHEKWKKKNREVCTNKSKTKKNINLHGKRKNEKIRLENSVRGSEWERSVSAGNSTKLYNSKSILFVCSFVHSHSHSVFDNFFTGILLPCSKFPWSCAVETWKHHPNKKAGWFFAFYVFFHKSKDNLETWNAFLGATDVK